MDLTEYVLLVLVAGGDVTTVSFRAGHALARRRQRTVHERMSRPQAGGSVECRPVADGATGTAANVERCPRCGGRRPDCDKDCVRPMDLGVPLRPGAGAER
ncbi:MAG: hypothetical protein IT372_23570 [Polyangiaceae bacterium]|nr:hypothetical protein [Polyangiaceae bacterium]